LHLTHDDDGVGFREGFALPHDTGPVVQTVAAATVHSVEGREVDAVMAVCGSGRGIDVKPDGDAMSGLLVTVLAGVAEFERELIAERAVLAAAAAIAAGRP
jgi:hypothetical protein